MLSSTAWDGSADDVSPVTVTMRSCSQRALSTSLLMRAASSSLASIRSSLVSHSPPPRRSLSAKHAAAADADGAGDDVEEGTLDDALVSSLGGAFFECILDGVSRTRRPSVTSHTGCQLLSCPDTKRWPYDRSVSCACRRSQPPALLASASAKNGSSA